MWDLNLCPCMFFFFFFNHHLWNTDEKKWEKNQWWEEKGWEKIRDISEWLYEFQNKREKIRYISCFLWLPKVVKNNHQFNAIFHFTIIEMVSRVFNLDSQIIGHSMLFDLSKLGFELGILASVSHCIHEISEKPVLG